MSAGPAGLIIPAAGAGTRSGVDYPKALAKIYDEFLITRTLCRLNAIDFAQRVVIARVQDLSTWQIGDWRGGRHRGDVHYSTDVIVQNSFEASGAVIDGLRHLSVKHAVVVWGDMISVSYRDVVAALKVARQTDAWAVVPVTWAAKPYTRLEIEADHVVAAHDPGHDIPGAAWRDTGCFVFDVDVALTRLREGQGLVSQLEGATVTKSRIREVRDFNYLNDLHLHSR